MFIENSVVGAMIKAVVKGAFAIRGLDSLNVSTKPDGSVITCGDYASDEAIIRSLSGYDEDAVIHTEESPAPYQLIVKSPSSYIVDPNDGSRNFAQERFAKWGIQIVHLSNGEPDAAVIFIPDSGELFYGVKGEGVFKRKLTLTEDDGVRFVARTKPERIILGQNHDTDLSGQVFLLTGKIGPMAARMKKLEKLGIRSVRVHGASCANYAEILKGTAIGYLENNVPGMHDTLPGAFLVREAGAPAVTLDSSQSWVTKGKTSALVARNPRLLAMFMHALCPELFLQFYGGKKLQTVLNNLPS